VFCQGARFFVELVDRGSGGVGWGGGDRKKKRDVMIYSPLLQVTNPR
jgi:hypothetical protein